MKLWTHHCGNDGPVSNTEQFSFDKIIEIIEYFSPISRLFSFRKVIIGTIKRTWHSQFLIEAIWLVQPIWFIFVFMSFVFEQNNNNNNTLDFCRFDCFIFEKATLQFKTLENRKRRASHWIDVVESICSDLIKFNASPTTKNTIIRMCRACVAGTCAIDLSLLSAESLRLDVNLA